MHAQKILSQVQKPFLKTGLPDFRSGDSVRVHVRVVEGESERIQPFEGVVLKRSGGGLAEVFTVRKISFGIGIERTFPLHSARIDKIEVLKSGHARRNRLYYLRKLSGKAARLSEKDKVDTGAEEETAAPVLHSTPETGKTHSKKASPEPVATR
ncbi:MAG: 50S ribosomal protein L19 [Elusimicrobia bacterium RIFCSPLOWO2_01_FULL_60_11]|nr:MAG: 50S ribosomal protein L19 [Elusimicrobia bacterium RIFCSPLOWO2_01_FULL_60_11]